MRLFAAGTFYLSRSSSLAAEYICDRDTIQQHRNTGLLLSTVIQMQIMERDTDLYLPDMQIYYDCDAVCDWLHASAHNIAWMVDYFEHLDVKCSKLFEMQPLTWDFKRKLRVYIDAFDCADTSDDWLPLSTSEARAAYISDIKRYQYRKVKPPFWLTFSAKAARTERAEQAQPAAPFELDLSPLWE